MLRPFMALYRFGDDPADDWKPINMRLHPDHVGASNAAADWVREQLHHVGIASTAAREHVAASRVAMREHPGTPVPVTLPGQSEPLLHVMTAEVVVPALHGNAA